jgi:lysyl-tRNA synthetase class 2
MSNSLKMERLRDRAYMFKQARLFFEKQNVIEVDCPILTAGASVDAHIDLMPALYQSKQKRYMHSSPEYGMKRLLAEGLGDIYQLSHVFRDGEYGFKHNPEFTMAEWYRLDFNLEQMIEDTVAFIRLFLGDLTFRSRSYRDTLIEYAGIDYVKLTEIDLLKYIKDHQIPYYPSVHEEGKDALLNLILSATVEPKLGYDELYVLAYYPATQAALAKKRWHGEEQVAERFEVYYQGVELANGYHELTDAVEQRQRFIEANQMRTALGKSQLPLDEHFLKALEKGIPNCSGVAVGFDRLMMLRHKESLLANVIAWDWEEA